MKFTDFTLNAGRIYSRRVQYTERLDRHAVNLCRDLLKRLRSSELEVDHGVLGLPPFLVSLGSPDYLRESMGSRVDHHGLIFCVRHPDHERPFQINLVLGPGDTTYDDTKPSAGAYAAGTVVALSSGFSLQAMSLERVEATVADILSSRPVLATTLDATVINAEHVETIKVAADFSTCFAAAMLTNYRN